MRKAKLCASFYPTTSVFVDDHAKFLKAVELICADINRPSLSFQNPLDALYFFEKKYQEKSFLNNCPKEIFSDEEDKLDHVGFDVNVRHIHHEIFNPKRFHLISTIFVDYDMPEMRGLPFIEALGYQRFRKIFLTGEASQEMAIQAFNEGMIDAYVSKKQDNLVELIKIVHAAQEKKYFLHLTNLLFSHALQNDRDLTFIDDLIFVDYFEKHCQKHNICEYYLLDNFGSYLLVDSSGKVSWFAVRSDKELEELYQHAKNENANQEIIDALKTKQKILFLPGDLDKVTPVSQWHNYLYPAQVIKSDVNYHVSHIEDSNLYAKELKKMAHYKDFMKDTLLSFSSNP